MNDQERNTATAFRFMPSYLDALDDLEPSDRHEALEAIVRYGILKEPYVGTNGTVKAVFKLIKPIIDRGHTMTEIGRQGGRHVTAYKPTLEELQQIADGYASEHADVDQTKARLAMKKMYEHYTAKDNWKNYRDREAVMKRAYGWLDENRADGTLRKQTPPAAKQATAYTGRQNIDWEERERQLILAQKRDQEIESEDLS